MAFSRDRIWRVIAYFKRGYGSWVSYVFGLASFVVVQYSLLISQVPMLQAFFSSILVFVVLFVVVVVPITVVIGYLDFHKGSVPVENSVATLASPYNTDLALAVCLLADGRGAEAKAVMSKWASCAVEVSG